MRRPESVSRPSRPLVSPGHRSAGRPGDDHHQGARTPAQAACGVARVSLVGTAAIAALALTLIGVDGQAPAVPTFRTASFTLHKNANGTAALTINPKELLEPAALQSDLAKYGIPAKVTVGSYCSSDPPPAGFSHVVTMPEGPRTVTPQSGDQPTITIDPSAMAAGTKLTVGDFRITTGELAGQQQATYALMSTSSYTCTTTPPPPPANGEGSQLTYGGPGPA
jgi:hypothetical protein